MDGFRRVTWAPPEGTLAAHHEPPLHFRLFCQLHVYTPQNHKASALHCQLPAVPPGPAPAVMAGLFSPIYILQECWLHRPQQRHNLNRTSSFMSWPLTSRLPYSICSECSGVLTMNRELKEKKRKKEKCSHFLENLFNKDRTKEFRKPLTLNCSFHRNVIIIKLK